MIEKTKPTRPTFIHSQQNQTYSELNSLYDWTALNWLHILRIVSETGRDWCYKLNEEYKQFTVWRIHSRNNLHCEYFDFVVGYVSLRSSTLVWCNTKYKKQETKNTSKMVLESH